MALRVLSLVVASALIVSASVYGPVEYVDRGGADLANVAATSIEDCQALCYARSDCQTWAFNTCPDGNNLNCWLKNSQPATSSRSCRASGVITAGRGTYGSIESIDRPGADLTNGQTTAKNANDCQLKCYDRSDCATWAFDSCGSTCWLKGSSPGYSKAGCRLSGMLTRSVPSCAYRNQNKWQGWNLLDQFYTFEQKDPTNGFVIYVSKSEAQNTGLLNGNNGQLYIGVDSTNYSPYGRKSVRLESYRKFGNGLTIIDLAHMPGSICGTWPAFWSFGDNWPNGGEIDIIEGVNNQQFNKMTLHTSSGCTISNQWQTGTTKTSNCDAYANGNTGCGVTTNKANAYGDSFNRNGGGVYAMERNDNNIRVWFFPRNAIPADVLTAYPNPCNWGQPDADFPLGNNCPKSKFTDHRMIFDITFCGDWAGQSSVYGPMCGGDCVQNVRDNSANFRESFWTINSLNYFTR